MEQSNNQFDFNTFLKQLNWTKTKLTNIICTLYYFCLTSCLFSLISGLLSLFLVKQNTIQFVLFNSIYWSVFACLIALNFFITVHYINNLIKKIITLYAKQFINEPRKLDSYIAYWIKTWIWLFKKYIYVTLISILVWSIFISCIFIFELSV